ncbi:MAG: phosphoenolpyruvate carboxykinase, partial [Coprothermobacterota bacterium]|nr:phosphoenolpyruvate carboxykinase [Coprothermobacterota bacterium]
IPKYDDLKPLFQEILGHDYTQKEYNAQFTVRIPELLAKIERVRSIFREKVADTPPVLMRVLDEQENRLLDFQKRFGDAITPDQLT